MIDTHYSPKKRRRYFKKRKIDLIFSATKYPFLAEFPEYKHKFRWLPFSINPSVYKDWGLEKSIKYLLMGQFYCEGLENPPKRIPQKVVILLEKKCLESCRNMNKMNLSSTSSWPLYPLQKSNGRHQLC